MEVTESEFGVIKIDGVDQKIMKITFKNGNGYTAEFIDLGARLVSFKGPSKTNVNANEELVLQHKTLEPMYNCGAYFGCTIGRYANRIANGKFQLDGVEYTLAINNGNNHLHGGLKGFDKKIWKYELINTPREIGVLFNTISSDMEEGYPGELKVTAKYVLTKNNELKWEFKANTNKKTIVNLTNHSYWNLSGDIEHNDIRNHKLQVTSLTYLPSIDMIPTGEYRKVKGTNFDFIEPTLLGPRLDNITDTGKLGLDHCFIFDGNALYPVKLIDEKSGRRMQISSNQPGIQIYTSNWLDGTSPMTPHRAIAFEPQLFPNSINTNNFLNPTISPEDTYIHKTTIKFDFIE